MKDFSGKVLFLDRADINTDEIIPAKYLTELTKEALKPHLLEGLSLEGFDAESIADRSVIVARDNFGCGSSREHAPWALETNGIYLVIAPSFARIFRQNMFNCGMMAVELPGDDIDRLFKLLKNEDAHASTDFETCCFVFEASGQRIEIPFSISEYDRALVEAGGWLEYADANY